MTQAISIAALGSPHDRKNFSCGVEAVDRYVREQAGQDVRRRAAACYVAVDRATGAVAGYYTLAASGIPLAEMHAELAKKLPRYPMVPVALLGRLAVSTAYHGQKLGAALLWDALLRSTRSEVAVFALVVDAKDYRAGAFYRHHGFVTLGANSPRLVLALGSTAGKPTTMIPLK